MKTKWHDLVALLLAVLWLAGCASMGDGGNSGGLSPRELEKLKHAKQIYDRRGTEVLLQRGEPVDRGSYPSLRARYDAECIAEGGNYYNGDVKVHRWGADLQVPLSEYRWDPAAGNRWWAANLMIYWNYEYGANVGVLQGPDILLEWEYVQKFTQEWVRTGRAASGRDGRPVPIVSIRAGKRELLTPEQVREVYRDLEPVSRESRGRGEIGTSFMAPTARGVASAARAAEFGVDRSVLQRMFEARLKPDWIDRALPGTAWDSRTWGYGDWVRLDADRAMGNNHRLAMRSLLPVPGSAGTIQRAD